MKAVSTRNTRAAPRRIQSVDRAVDILFTVARSRQPLSASEAALRLRLERTTVHRLMATLAASHLLAFDPERRKYRIGPGSFELGSAYLRGQIEDRVVERIMDDLAREVGHTVALGALVNGEVVILLARQGAHVLLTNARPGDRLAAHATSIGKLFLAELPDAGVRQVLQKTGLPRLTPRTITGIKPLLSQLAAVRREGVAYAHEEVTIGVSSVGVAVRRPDGRIAAGLVVAPPAQLATPEALAAMIPALRKAAARIETAGGLQTP